MKWVHRYWKKQLSAYLDGELKGKSLQRVELHISDCQKCQHDLEIWKQYRLSVKNTIPQGPSRDLFAGIMNRLDTQPAKLSFWEDLWMWHRLPPVTLTVSSALLVLALVISLQPIMKNIGTNTETILGQDSTVDYSTTLDLSAQPAYLLVNEDV